VDAHGNPVDTVTDTLLVPCRLMTFTGSEEFEKVTAVKATHKLFLDDAQTIDETDEVLAVVDVNSTTVLTTAKVTFVNRLYNGIGRHHLEVYLLEERAGG